MRMQNHIYDLCNVRHVTIYDFNFSALKTGEHCIKIHNKLCLSHSLLFHSVDFSFFVKNCIFLSCCACVNFNLLLLLLITQNSSWAQNFYSKILQTFFNSKFTVFPLLSFFLKFSSFLWTIYDPLNKISCTENYFIHMEDLGFLWYRKY